MSSSPALYKNNHYSNLLNANSYDATLKTSWMSRFNKVLYCNYMIFPGSLISETIKELECGKSAGPDGVHGESIIFAYPRLHVADSNYYRPIAIATIVSTLFESITLYKFEEFLYTCDHQFGF